MPPLPAIGLGNQPATAARGTRDTGAGTGAPPPTHSDGAEAGGCWHRRPARWGQARSRHGWGGPDRRPQRCRRQRGPHSVPEGQSRGSWPGRRPRPTATWCPRPDERAERARRARRQQMTPPPPHKGQPPWGCRVFFCSISAALLAQGCRRPRSHCDPEPPPFPTVVAHCALPSVQCMLHPVVHGVRLPVVHCVPCSVLAVHAHCRGAVRCALHIVLLVHPGAVPCPLFPVPLHPPLPDLPALHQRAESTAHNAPQATVHSSQRAVRRAQDDRGPCATAARPLCSLWGRQWQPPRRVAPLGRPTPSRRRPLGVCPCLTWHTGGRARKRHSLDRLVPLFRRAP